MRPDNPPPSRILPHFQQLGHLKQSRGYRLQVIPTFPHILKEVITPTSKRFLDGHVYASTKNLFVPNLRLMRGL